MEYRQVRRLLLVLRGQLLLQQLEALLEVRPPVLLELVVNLPRSRAYNAGSEINESSE